MIGYFLGGFRVLRVFKVFRVLRGLRVLKAFKGGYSLFLLYSAFTFRKVKRSRVNPHSDEPP